MTRHLWSLLFLLVWTPVAAAQDGRLQQAKPWLGVAIDQGKTGVLIKEVLPGTPAEDAGLKAGDEITSVDKTNVNAPPELIKAVQAQGVGNSVVVAFTRAGKAETKTVKLVARPDELALLRQKLVDKPAPKFDLPVLHGTESGNSEKLKGKVVIVEFWATWCPACRSTHDRLSQFAKSHKNVAVVAISDEEAGPIKDYVKHVNPSFTILQDKTQAASGAWMVSAIPELAVIDTKGVVAFATMGAGSYLEEALSFADKLEAAH